jgi:hypothetical protein
LRDTALWIEVGQHAMVTGGGCLEREAEAPIGVETRVFVGEVLEVLADDEEVEELLMDRLKSRDGLAGARIADGELEPYCAFGRGLDAQIQGILDGSVRKLLKFHPTSGTVARDGGVDVGVHRTSELGVLRTGQQGEDERRQESRAHQ